MRFKQPTLKASRRRLDAAITIYALEAIAQRRTPKKAVDADSAGDGEFSLTSARRVFESVKFCPSIRSSVSAVDRRQDHHGAGR